MIISAKDVPIFYYFEAPELSAFKMFFWMKSILRYKVYQDEKFRPALVPQSLIALGKMKESDRMLVSQKTIGPISISSEDSAMADAGPDIITPAYPSGPFTINKTKVVYIVANTPWLSLADQYNIPLSRLLDFNDLERDDDILQKPQLVFLQRKRKVGGSEFHVMKNGENLSLK